MCSFPTVQALASAEEANVLAHWQGLGYYSRARNLRKGAQCIVQNHHGEMPIHRAALEAIPGIGNYTAGAILSLAQHQHEAILDGNLIRIFARWQCWVSLPTESKDWHKSYWALAQQFASTAQPHLINEALMEFGALVCTPKQPRCEECCVQSSCQAFQQGSVAMYPTLKAKQKNVAVFGLILCVIHNDKILMEKSAQGLLAGQWKLPLLRTAALPHKAPTEFIQAALGVARIRKLALIGKIRHAITHHKIELAVCEIHVDEQSLPKNKDSEYAWIAQDKFAQTVVNSLSHKAWKLLRASTNS
jgi:A/G-specific adenine glycosylase